MTHGTPTAYNKGCRCARCFEAASIRNWENRNPGKTHPTKEYTDEDAIEDLLLVMGMTA